MWKRTTILGLVLVLMAVSTSGMFLVPPAILATVVQTPAAGEETPGWTNRDLRMTSPLDGLLSSIHFRAPPSISCSFV